MKNTGGKVDLKQKKRHLIIGVWTKGIKDENKLYQGWRLAGQAKKNGNEIPPNGLNFPSYACQMGKLSSGRQVEESFGVI